MFMSQSYLYLLLTNIYSSCMSCFLIRLKHNYDNDNNYDNDDNYDNDNVDDVVIDVDLNHADFFKLTEDLKFSY